MALIFYVVVGVYLAFGAMFVEWGRTYRNMPWWKAPIVILFWGVIILLAALNSGKDGDSHV